MSARYECGDVFGVPEHAPVPLIDPQYREALWGIDNMPEYETCYKCGTLVKGALGRDGTGWCHPDSRGCPGDTRKACVVPGCRDKAAGTLTRHHLLPPDPACARHEDLRSRDVRGLPRGYLR